MLLLSVQVSAQAPPPLLRSNSETETELSVLRTYPDNSWNAIQNDKAFIYTHSNPPPPQDEKAWKPWFNISALLNGVFIRWLFFLLVGVTLIIIVYHLFSGDGTFIRKKKKQKATEDAIPDDSVESFNNWDHALQQALNNEDYRLAVRVLYLQSLQHLDRGGWIRFELKQTNIQYVRQLESTPYKASFAVLTTYFDYVWYGSFVLDQNRYKDIENLYHEFQKQVS